MSWEMYFWASSGEKKNFSTPLWVIQRRKSEPLNPTQLPSNAACARATLLVHCVIREDRDSYVVHLPPFSGKTQDIGAVMKVMKLGHDGSRWGPLFCGGGCKVWCALSNRGGFSSWKASFSSTETAVVLQSWPSGTQMIHILLRLDLPSRSSHLSSKAVT